MLTNKRLLEVLDYDKKNGKFTWRGAHGRVKKGKTAGHMTSGGYIGISIDGNQYQASKLALFYECGEYPKEQITHINLDKLDNRISNLKKREDKDFSQDEIKKYFDYRLDGVLVWKVKKGTANIGDAAGSEDKKTGYRNIKFQGKSILAHRLIFMYHNGYFPENHIDHIDRDTRNNRIENLREVSVQCNLRNSKVNSKNTSGVKGVTFCKQTGKWKSTITKNHKNYTIGRYRDFSEAVLHRLSAEQCLNWNICDANSSAYLYCINNGLIQGVK